MISAYDKGREVCRKGMSIHANPYRNTLDDGDNFMEWRRGWEYENEIRQKEREENF